MIIAPEYLPDILGFRIGNPLLPVKGVDALGGQQLQVLLQTVQLSLLGGGSPCGGGFHSQLVDDVFHRDIAGKIP